MRRCGGELGHVFPGDAVAGTPCECGAYERNESVRGFRDRPPDLRTRLRRAVDLAVVVLIAACCAWSLVVLVAACNPAPARKAKIWPAGAPGPSGNTTWFWCAAATRDDGEGLLACADTQPTCNVERAAALHWGGIAHIKEVGECTQIEVEP